MAATQVVDNTWVGKQCNVYLSSILAWNIG
jgi:hypothetical protein